MNRSFYRLTLIVFGFCLFMAATNGQAMKKSGLASSYPASSAGRLTASGEVYDNTLLTASHAYLPFNTIVRVTNLRTNVSVLVRINDRFQFKTNRLIDVSGAAANELGLFSNVAPMVSIEVVEWPTEKTQVADEDCCDDI